MLTFTLRPQRTAGHGPPEERATFGTLEVRANERCLTEGVAQDGSSLSTGPNVSGYHIAEWMLWNIWRLRWEARPDSGGDWAFSHCLASIGEGYVWPNIEISSDGVRVILASLPTIDPASGLYRYMGTPAVEVIAASELEYAVLRFAGDVLRLLGRAEVRDTNLHSLWQDVERERQDPDAARLRRLEARRAMTRMKSLRTKCGQPLKQCATSAQIRLRNWSPTRVGAASRRCPRSRNSPRPPSGSVRNCACKTR